MNTNDSIDGNRDRAVRLFRFLRELANLEYKAIASIERYDTHVWLSQIADTQVELPNGSDSWFFVPRVLLPELPVPPAALDDWLDPKELTDWANPLTLPESITLDEEPAEDEQHPEPRDEVAYIADHPEVQAAWATYKPLWDRWSNEREALNPSYETYVAMFRMYQRVQQSGEQYELRLGVGLLEGKFSATVKRHLVTAPIDLEMEGDGTITVREASFQAHGYSFEDDMLATDALPPVTTGDRTRSLVSAVDDLLEPGSIEAALGEWFSAVDVDARFDHSWQPQPRSDLTRVTHAPAIFLRKRTQRNLVATYDAIIGELHAGTEVPDTILDMVSFAGGEYGDEPSLDGGTGDRIFFPLPASPQQRSIVRQLSSRRGIIVQGPPGTGKSQTIANLICHALASGQRVLVTSHTSRALKVLQDKLPQEFRSLAVSATGEGKASSEDVRQSASQLLARMNDSQWSQAVLAERIDELEAQVDELEQRRAVALSAIEQAAAEQHADVDLGGSYVGGFADVVRRLAHDQEELGWIPDSEVQGEPPGSGEDLSELIEFRRWRDALSDVDRSRRVVDPLRLPDPGRVREAFSASSDARRRIVDAEDLDLIERNLNTLPADRRAQVGELARAVVRHERAVEGRSLPWLDAARVEIEHGRDERWRDLAERTQTFLNGVEGSGSPGDRVTVSASLNELQTLIYQGESVASYLQSGKSLNRLIKPKILKEAADFLGLTLDGRPIDDLATCRSLLARLSTSAALTTCERHWQGKLSNEADANATLSDRVSRLRDAQESLGLVLELHNARVRAGESLELPDPEILPASAGRIVECVALAELEQTNQQIADVASSLEKETRPSDGEPPNYFGSCSTALRQRDAAAYQAAFEELTAAHQVYTQLKAGNDLEKRWAEACPAVAREASALVANPAADLSRFKEAWAWRRAKTMLDQQYKSEMATYFEVLSEINESIREHTGQLGSTLAWRHALAGLSNEQTQHLKAYQKALERLGKGTGKRASQHRESARQHLADCQDAIPAWIVPTFRLAETMVPRPEAFDLVIVDEASQSGSTALFLLWLGKQIVIVGDDQQISPSNVGMNDSDVARIQADYLDGFELKDMFDAKHSLFDQAHTRYQGETWLTEHFRCMPEIIDFSNRAVYDKLHRRLEPLRRFGSDRLLPLKATFVADADEIDKVNRLEAEAVADAVMKCMENPAYEGKTLA